MHQKIIGDFYINCVLYEEAPVNIMTERTWEAIGRPAMAPSLGGIGLFIRKFINLCGRLTQIPMNVNRTSQKPNLRLLNLLKTMPHLPCY
jgi:hypothetical protein